MSDGAKRGTPTTCAAFSRASSRAASGFVDEVADGDLAAEGRPFLLLEFHHGGDCMRSGRARIDGDGGYQPGDGFTVAGNGDGFSSLDPLQQLRQMRLGR